MLSNKTIKEDLQEKAFTAFTIFPKYVFWIGSFSCVQILISIIFFSDELIALGRGTYANFVILLVLPIFILFIAILLHISPLIYHIFKHITSFILKKKSTFYIDMLASTKEQAEPTKSFYKVSRVFIWGLSICTVLGIFASAIYTVTSVLLQG